MTDIACKDIKLDTWFVVYDDVTHSGRHRMPDFGWIAICFKELEDGTPIHVSTLPSRFGSEEEAHAWVDAQNAKRGVRVIYPNAVKRPISNERERIHAGIAKSGGCRTTPGIIAGPFTCPSCGETRQAPEEYAGGVWYESAGGTQEHVCICEECSRKYDPAMRGAEE